MAFTVSHFKNRTMRVLAAAFAQASLTSFAPYIDPSLQAALEYRPDLWNDVGNDDLAAFYRDHSTLVESIIVKSFGGDLTKAGRYYPRNAHASQEKAFQAILSLNEAVNHNPKRSLQEITTGIAYT